MVRAPLAEGQPGGRRDADAIAGRALRGGIALGARQALAHGVNLLGTMALARLLTPEQFGAVSVALFVQNVLLSTTALGLATGLVRQAEEPRRADYRSVFATHQLVTLIAASIGWLAIPRVIPAGDAQSGQVFLLRAVALGVLLFPLQTIPTARLERDLRFGRLAVVEVCQAVVFNGIAVFLSWRGLGVQAVAIGVVARAAVGAALANLARPWPIGLAFAADRLRALARFGLPFQAVGLISLVKDSLTPVLIGLTAGTAAVGRVSFAQTLATYPSLALMILGRLYLPAFAHLQDDRDELGRLVERAIRATNATAAPLAVLTLVLIGPIIDLGFGRSWRSAEDLFYWLWCANLIVPTVTPLLGLLNAVGRSRTVLGFAVLWMVATWAIGAPLVLAWGPIGFGVANLLVQTTGVWVISIARRLAPFRITSALLPSWPCALAVGAGIRLAVRAHPPESLVGLAETLIAGLAAYALIFAALRPGDLRRTWALLRARP